MAATEGVMLQVDDVYVPLGLVERKKPPKRKDQDDISPEQGSELYKETEITKTFEHGAFLEEVIKQKNTPKSQGKRIAIIGEPGAGKTTLLQQIADWVSREIQQSIVIWVSLADLRGKELKAYLFDTWLTQVAEKIGKAEATQQLKNDFVDLLNQKNVWLLLDGLDEMSASNPLTEISHQFQKSGLISQSRIVLTCRVNLWDGGSNALDDFDIYRTLDFSYPEHVERFIDKWFNKIEIPETGKQLCNALEEPGKERIRDLVKNPLRLTLLCLNWQSGDGNLPDTQAGLYQQFVDDFYKWKKEEFAINSHQRQQLNIKLGELAKVAIDQEANRFRLRQDFVSQFLGDADDENSLLKLALNRGWLNQVGIDINKKPVYAFFHASFQEYFAAKAIDDWHFFLNHVVKNPSQGTYRIFEPQWKQIILLWLGRNELEKECKDVFLNQLIKFDDKCGVLNFYWSQAHELANFGLKEFPESSFNEWVLDRIEEDGEPVYIRHFDAIPEKIVEAYEYPIDIVGDYYKVYQWLDINLTIQISKELGLNKNYFGEENLKLQYRAIQYKSYDQYVYEMMKVLEERERKWNDFICKINQSSFNILDALKQKLSLNSTNTDELFAELLKMLQSKHDFITGCSIVEGLKQILQQDKKKEHFSFIVKALSKYVGKQHLDPYSWCLHIVKFCACRYHRRSCR